MNDNLQPVPDEHLEARITAYILGEASPFEAAEIESLIAKSPELKLFANRTRTLNALLKDAETTSNSPDAEWKLSTEKRAALAPHLGPVPVIIPHRENRIRRASFRAALGIAAVFLVTLFTKRFFIFTDMMQPEVAMEVSHSSAYNSAVDKESRILALRGVIPKEKNNEEIRHRDLIVLAPDLARSSGDAGISDGRRSKENAQQSESDALERNIDRLDLAGAKHDLGRDSSRLENMKMTLESVEASERLSSKKKEVTTAKPTSRVSRQLSAAPASAPASVKKMPFENQRKIIAGNKADPTSVPVPEIEIAESSSEFGDGPDFGDGRGDAAITRNNIDAILNNPVQDEEGDDVNFDDGVVIERIPSARAVGGKEGQGASADDWFVKSHKDKNEKLQKGIGGGESRDIIPSVPGTPKPVTERIKPPSPDYLLGKVKRGNGADIDEKQTEGWNLAPNDMPPLKDGKFKNLGKNKDLELAKSLGESIEKSARSVTLAQSRTGEKRKQGMEREEELKEIDLKKVELKRELEDMSEDLDREELDLTDGGEIERFEATLHNIQDKGDEEESGLLGMDRSKVPEGMSHNLDTTPQDTKREIETVQQDPKSGALKEPGQLEDAEDSAKIPDLDELPAILPLNLPKLTKGLDDLGEPVPESGAELVDHNSPVGSSFSDNLDSASAAGQMSEEDNAPPPEELDKLKQIQSNKKPVDLADLSQEIPAEQEPFSTFSLNISDASFQVASSAVANGERPDPASIKPEQFYNGVSYDDPAPSAGEPVAAAIGQIAHPIIPGRNLVRMSVRTASTGRAATQPLVLTLLVDQSGSMARADRRAAMNTALTQLATLMQPDDRITVIGFSRTPSLLADSISGDDAAQLPDIINQSSSKGGTNIEQALNLAENLALRHKVDGAQNRIVLFTDGAANLGNADPELLAERVKDLRQQDLAFDIAGIGTDDINDRLLSELSRHGNGRYYLVGENTAGNLAKQLAGAFRPAAENVKIQVKFNPQRVGNYKLIGFEKDRLKTEDFRNDSVDAAELAADESGTALYQVEPLPNGSGEIGELYVRFRDTATGEMVERSWTIPYESQAPAIDRSRPQMQLAALSLLAAQKLQPGPLADAINFRDLAATIAAVKQAYAHSPQAQQMITLINALK